MLGYEGRMFGGSFAYAMMDRSWLPRMIIFEIMASRMVTRLVT